MIKENNIAPNYLWSSPQLQINNIIRCKILNDLVLAINIITNTNEIATNFVEYRNSYSKQEEAIPLL